MRSGLPFHALAGLGLLGGCDLVLGIDVEPPSNTDMPDAAVTCTPGETIVLPGALRSVAPLGGGAVIGYQRSNNALEVARLDAAGAVLGLPLLVFDSGDALRLHRGDTGRVALSFHSSAATGWDQIFTASLTIDGFVDAPMSRTLAGTHSTSAVAISRADSYLVAMRAEVPSVPSYNLRLQTYDASWSEVAGSILDLSLGVPVAASVTTAGYLLQTDQNLIAVNPDATLGSILPLAGYDPVDLVRDTAPETPQLVRAASGGLELVELAADGTVARTQVLAMGRAALSSMATAYAPTGTLVVWRESDQVYGLRADAQLQVRPIAVAGTNLGSVGVVQASAGPLVAIERDASGGGREVAVVQTCGW